MTDRFRHAAVSVESGSTILGQGMRASSENGLAVRIDEESKAYLQNSSLDGGVEVLRGSFADLRGASVSDFRGKFDVPESITDQEIIDTAKIIGADPNQMSENILGVRPIGRWARESGLEILGLVVGLAQLAASIIK